MEIFRLIGVAAALAAPIATCFAAMQNEPADFRGIPWGAPIENHKSDLFALADKGDIVYFRRPKDEMSWGGAEIQKISYRFYKGKFSGTTLQLFGVGNQKAITEKLFGLYGPPERPNKRVPRYVWSGDQATVILFCEITHYCVVELASTQLMAQEQNDQPKTNDAKDDD